MTARTGTCTACGLAVRAHFNAQNRMIGCAGAAQTAAPVDRGHLLKLKIKFNFAARQKALASIHPRPGGGYTARIGGTIKGRTVTALTRVAIEKLINAHYNEHMMAFVERRAPSFDKTGA